MVEETEEEEKNSPFAGIEKSPMKQPLPAVRESKQTLRSTHPSQVSLGKQSD